GQGSRPAAGNTGPSNSEGSVARPPARVWSAAAHSADLGRGTGNSAGVVVSSPLSTRASGHNHQRVGREREQPAREVLPADHGGAEAAGKRNGEVESHGGDHRR